MKMVKSLLLGSAAGLVAVAGAQAADLPVKAKPVEYVKICTLYGDGFYYIPGSQTCLKLSGYVRADYGYNVDTNVVQVYGPAGGAQDRFRGESRRNAYTTRHRANASFDTRTQTAYGTLRTFASLHFENSVDAADGSINVNELTVQRAFIQWAGFTLGRTASFVDPAGQLGDSGARSLHQMQVESTTGASGINQIAYTWQLGNGVTFNIGADEERVRGINNMSGTPTANPGSAPGGNGRMGQQAPSPWVSLRVNQAWGAASVAFIAQNMRTEYYQDDGTAACASQPGTTLCTYPSNEFGWGVLSGAQIRMPWIAPGDRLNVYFNYSVGAVRFAANNLQSPGLYGSRSKGGNNVAFGWTVDGIYFNGTDIEKTTAWATGAGYEHYWSPQWSTTVYGGIASVEYNDTVINSGAFCTPNGVTPLEGQACDPSFKYWAIGTHTDWFPVPGFRLAVDVLYTQINTAMKGQVYVNNQVSGRPTGQYTARNLGITSVMFRAQRNWGGGD